jgi:hypothetical protein
LFRAVKAFFKESDFTSTREALGNDDENNVLDVGVQVSVVRSNY